MSTHIWLRAESKPLEERTALTPACARELIESGFEVTVEASSQRAVPATAYESVGCKLVKPHSWKSDAPPNALILGLKELETSTEPLRHRHIHFAHVYKNQLGWEAMLRRFVEGGGALYDLEFLVDEHGRRVAAFGHWAGYAGAALAILAWCRQTSKLEPVLPPIKSRPSQSALLKEVREAIAGCGSPPRVMIIGALGRVGGGAVELCEGAGAGLVKWDLEETRRGGPFAEILDVDVLLNCVFVQRPVPPFATIDMLDQPQRRLSVICDISCDPYGNYNPLPIYDKCTTFAEPTLRLLNGDPPLDLIAIDHLPSLLPVESSEDFCTQLLPYLRQLNRIDEGVWKRAHDLFQQKTALIRQEN